MPLSMTATFTSRPVLPPKAHSGPTLSIGEMDGTSCSVPGAKTFENAGCLSVTEQAWPCAGVRGECLENCRAGIRQLNTTVGHLEGTPADLEPFPKHQIVTHVIALGIF